MHLTGEQFRRIEGCFPTQQGHVKISNLTVLNAILNVAENGCKWRSLPNWYGWWHTICTRMHRWAKAGVLDRVFTALQDEEIIRVKVEAGGEPKFIWLPRMTGELGPSPSRRAIGATSPAGRDLLRCLPPQEEQLLLIMDRAYKGDVTRQFAIELGFGPVVPPKSTAASHGPTTNASTAGATRSSVRSDGSRRFTGSSPSSTSSMSCSPPSFTSHSPPRPVRPG